MSRRSIAVAAVLMTTILAAPGASAQMVFRHGGGGQEADIVVLRELGVVAGVEEASGDLQVLVVLPDAEPEVPLERGDLLLMIDGKRVRDTAAVREIYEAAEVGAVIKVGFRRGDERFLASFEKEEEEPGAVRMMVVGGPGSEGGDMQPLMEFGVILQERDGAVVVGMQMPVDEPALLEDDVLKSINGRQISSLADFREAYGALAVGDDVALLAMRGDEEIASTRTKQEQTGRVRVRRAN